MSRNPQGSLRVLIAVDESEPSMHALRWATATLASSADESHLVNVLPPLNYVLSPPVPIATAGSVMAITQNWEAQKKSEQQAAEKLLNRMTEMALLAGASEAKVEGHLVPAMGGASGVGESIVHLATRTSVDVVVLGSRGYGSFKRTIMSCFGLGSVSEYVAHHLHLPVCIVPPPREEGPARGPANSPALPVRRLCVAIDDSAQAQAALRWMLERLARPQDELHFIAVAVPVAYPFLDEAAAGVAALETERYQREKEAVRQAARQLCQDAIHAALQHHFAAERLFYRALAPEGGASDVAESICHYARDNKVDLMVLGNRGTGALRRAALSFIGLGSVSDYCSHNCRCPVLIVKEDAPSAGNGAAPAGAAAVAGATASPPPQGREAGQAAAAAAAAAERLQEVPPAPGKAEGLVHRPQAVAAAQAVEP